MINVRFSARILFLLPLLAAVFSFPILAQEPLAAGVSGRVIDGRTGQGLEWATVYLHSCPGGDCNALAGMATTDAAGRFRFAPDAYTLYSGVLPAGEYGLYVYAGGAYEALTVPPFTLAEGQDLDLGDVAVSPVPAIGEVRGRLVDSQTGAPLTAADIQRFARVELQACSEWGCGTVEFAYPGSDGRFVFPFSQYNPKPPGRYRIFASADQYHLTPGPEFEVADRQSLDLGDVGLKSYPVRLYLAQGCDRIPSAGGECQFRVKVTNGGTSRLQAETWTLVRAAGAFPAEYTAFPVASPKAINLDPAASVEIGYSFNVPAAAPDGSSICARTYVARRPSPFDAVGLYDVLCLGKGDLGYEMLSPAEKNEVLKKEKGVQPRP